MRSGSDYDPSGRQAKCGVNSTGLKNAGSTQTPI